jgi:hypothetical protein
MEKGRNPNQFQKSFDADPGGQEVPDSGYGVDLFFLRVVLFYFLVIDLRVQHGSASYSYKRSRIK